MEEERTHKFLVFSSCVTRKFEGFLNVSDEIIEEMNKDTDIESSIIDVAIALQAPIEPIIKPTIEKRYFLIEEVEEITEEINNRTHWSIFNEYFNEIYYKKIYKGLEKYKGKKINNIFEVSPLIFSERAILYGQLTRFTYNIIKSKKYDHIFYINDTKVFSTALSNSPQFFLSKKEKEDEKSYICEKCGGKKVLLFNVPRDRKKEVDKEFYEISEEYKEFEGKDDPRNPSYIKRMYENYDLSNIKEVGVPGTSDLILKYADDFIRYFSQGKSIKELCDIEVLQKNLEEFTNKDSGGKIVQSFRQMGFSSNKYINELGIKFFYGFLFCPPVLARRGTKIKTEVPKLELAIEKVKEEIIKNPELNANHIIVNIPFPIIFSYYKNYIKVIFDQLGISIAEIDYFKKIRDEGSEITCYSISDVEEVIKKVINMIIEGKKGEKALKEELKKHD
jgi:hypothetical protein